MGKVLRSVLGENPRRLRPGRSKRNKNPAWAYYGISQRSIPPLQQESLAVPESWGNPQDQSSQMLPGVDQLIEQIRTPDDNRQLLDENAALKKQLGEVEKAGQRKIENLLKKLHGALEEPRRTTPLVPPCMYLRRNDNTCRQSCG